MNTFQPKLQANPLIGYMRQPKILIKLPSKGNYWPNGSLEISETGDYPVYSMTAKDELMLKIPDALISGQAIVEVIQHCVPNIKNAWAIPGVDLDVILIAIRIATYGEIMKVPLTKGEVTYDYEIDLRYVMGALQEQIRWEDSIQITPDLVVYVKPVDYRQISASATKTFETQRILQIANDSKLSDVEKNKSFKDAINTLNDITVGLVTNSIYKIDSAQGLTEDLKFIKEFMDNVDKEVFDIVKSHIEKLRENNNIKPMFVTPSQDMIEKGFPKEDIEIPLVFDPSTFFG